MSPRNEQDQFYWSKKHEHCQNCHSAGRPHHAKGLCARCYDLLQIRQNVDKATIVRVPDRGPPNDWCVRDHRGRVRFSGRRWHCETALRLAKENASASFNAERWHGRMRRSTLPIDGMDFESEMIFIANACGLNGSRLYHGTATAFNFLRPSERARLFGLLGRIREHKRTGRYNPWPSPLRVVERQCSECGRNKPIEEWRPGPCKTCTAKLKIWA